MRPDVPDGQHDAFGFDSISVGAWTAGPGERIDRCFAGISLGRNIFGADVGRERGAIGATAFAGIGLERGATARSNSVVPREEGRAEGIK